MKIGCISKMKYISYIYGLKKYKNIVKLLIFFEDYQLGAYKQIVKKH